MEKFNPLIEADEDGLFTPSVKIWSVEKYRLLGTYLQVFTTSMAPKWDNLVYIDLFAGAGFANIENQKTYYSSALIALSLPFTHYIICEEDTDRYNALNARIKRLFPEKNVKLIHGNSNEQVEKVKSYIPKYSKQNRVLTFCFVDPFSLNLEFKTISTLSRDYNIDFLILLALQMDANRNLTVYLNQQNDKVDKFIDNPLWREDYKTKFGQSGESFIKFLIEEYQSKMQNLGYQKPAEMQRIKIPDKNVPLYYLAFFTKHPLGNKFWKEVKDYGNNQISLF